MPGRQKEIFADRNSRPAVKVRDPPLAAELVTDKERASEFRYRQYSLDERRKTKRVILLCFFALNTDPVFRAFNVAEELPFLYQILLKGDMCHVRTDSKCQR